MASDNFLIITFHNKSTSYFLFFIIKNRLAEDKPKTHIEIWKKIKTTDTSWKLSADDYFHPN